MFDFDLGKLLLIGVVALIFIPPKDLPAALRQIGRLVSQARRIAADFQGQFNEALREAELTDIKDEFDHLKKSASLEGAMSQIAEIGEPAKHDEPAKIAEPTKIAELAEPLKDPAAAPPHKPVAESQL